MGENSKIEWCDHTFNPWIGCQKVSAGCDNCYAETLMDKRYHKVEWGPHGERKRTSEANWKLPLRWARAARGTERRPRVFCASLADVFDNQVPSEWREDLFELIRVTPNLLWLLLTKRPQNIVKMVQTSGAIAGNGTRYLPGNVALGTTIEDQTRADINIPALLDAKVQCGPAFVFVSCEPLLGPIDFAAIPFGDGDPRHRRDALTGQARMYCDGLNGHPDFTVLTKFEVPMARIDQVIAGGETDQGKHQARPSNPAWFRSLRDQCAAAGTAFLFKQWGEWSPHDFQSNKSLKGELCVWPDGRTGAGGANAHGGAGCEMDRVGKKKAGRLLDGVEHNGMPV